MLSQSGGSKLMIVETPSLWMLLGRCSLFPPLNQVLWRKPMKTFQQIRKTGTFLAVNPVLFVAPSLCWRIPKSKLHFYRSARTFCNENEHGSQWQNQFCCTLYFFENYVVTVNENRRIETGISRTCFGNCQKKKVVINWCLLDYNKAMVQRVCFRFTTLNINSRANWN